ncbi:hypothetical protein [Sphaerotilus natans]|nr:hypothetical protein [Sphaerotilus natans]
MRPLSQFIVLALICNLSGYAVAAEPIQRGVAAPFGVQVGANGSCDALLKRLGSPPVNRLSEDDPSNISFEAKSPDVLFPNARSISVFCNGGLAWTVTLVVNRSRPADQELADVLQGMTEKYGGSPEIDAKGYGFFKARNARIAIVAGPNWFVVQYEYHADEKREKSEAVDKSKKRRDAL